MIPTRTGSFSARMEAAAEVVPSTFYTFGLCLAFHSRLDFNECYAYTR